MCHLIVGEIDDFLFFFKYSNSVSSINYMSLDRNISQSQSQLFQLENQLHREKLIAGP